MGELTTEYLDRVISKLEGSLQSGLRSEMLEFKVDTYKREVEMFQRGGILTGSPFLVPEVSMPCIGNSPTDPDISLDEDYDF